MSAAFLSWSFSRLKQFKDCPKQLYHNAVAPKYHPDRVPYVEGKAQRDGKLVDEALTRRIASGVPLPLQYQPYEGMVQAIMKAPGAKLAQMQIALNQAFQQVGSQDWDNAWVRTIYDIAIVNGEHGFIGDWKNGQVWIDEDQLRLFAATGFHVFPELEVIDTAYIWLKHGITSDKTYTRRELPDMWNTFLPDVERMQVAYKTTHWPAAPRKGDKTCRWCPANQAKKCAQAQGPYGG